MKRTFGALSDGRMGQRMSAMKQDGPTAHVIIAHGNAMGM
jgi:hypothetical protein